MAATVTQRGLTMFIVGTSITEILGIIDSGTNYHEVKAMYLNTTGSVYHIIAQA